MYVPAPEHTGQISAWLERELGGRVVNIKQQPRWRPVWFADLERDGETLELCVRAERSDMALIFPLEHEMRFQSLLEERGIPCRRGPRNDRFSLRLRDGPSQGPGTLR